MSMRLDMIWHEGDEMQYRASCAECTYQSGIVDDEDTAAAAWFGHVCVRPSRSSA